LRSSGFGILEGITPLAEYILTQLLDGQRELTPPLVTIILETVDAIKKVLVAIGKTGSEGPDTHARLRERLEAARRRPQASAAVTPSPSAPEAPQDAGAAEGGSQAARPYSAC
jgi:two-component system chemotaxis sensor kinase CheA